MKRYMHLLQCGMPALSFHCHSIAAGLNHQQQREERSNIRALAANCGSSRRRDVVKERDGQQEQQQS